MLHTASAAEFLHRTKLILVAIILFSCFCTSALADTQRGVLIYPATIYLTPDQTSSKLGTVQRGDEVAVLEKSHEWVHTLAMMGPVREDEYQVDEGDISTGRSITGWVLDKGIVLSSTPNGDQILFGAAVEAENEASRAHGRKGADQEAFRLYSRTAEYFPQSPLAGEAAYRAADIKWQLERADVMSRPSAKEKEAFLRRGMNEDLMRRVMKKYPHTQWADMAAFHLIENKICGDWQGSSQCPEKESEFYEKYVKEHPDSPADSEALYDAAWRQSALIEIYKTENNQGKSAQAKSRATSLAQQAVAKNSQSDWARRAQTLLYMVEQNIPTYGNATE